MCFRVWTFSRSRRLTTSGLHDWLDNQNGAVLIANYLDQLTLTQADIHELKGACADDPREARR